MPTLVSAGPSPVEHIHAQLDELLASQQDLG